ncbi:MAG: FAD:protein FMN transferase [Burkholderiaceae bacterium]|nr:FAD:protein FMN transferase [Burkholderiaceae bacterium]
MHRRHFSLGLLVTLGLQVPARAADARVQHELQAALGTRVGITVVHASPALRRQALDEAWQLLREREAQMSRYRQGNALQALAEHAGQPGWQPVPAPLLQVLQAAQAVSAFTDGAFDATVGAYRDWQFGDAASAPQVVSEARLRQQRPAVGWRALQLDAPNGRARLARPGMALDLGGIAKLAILDEALQRMAALGIAQAMIDGGGDVLCRGGLLDRAWRVGVRDPLAPQRLLGVVGLHDGIVASSGDYERGFDDAAGRRWHHVLEPASGWPTRGVHGVALLAGHAAEVNGLGTAIMVGGPGAARRWLAQRPGVQALLATPQGHAMTPGFAARLQAAAG